RFGQAETADGFALGQAREPVALLLLASELVDGVHDQGALHGREAADARIARLPLLPDQAVGHVADAGAAVFLRQVGAQQAPFAEKARPLLGELALLPEAAGHGDDGFLHELPYHVPNRPLLGREQFINPEKIGHAAGSFPGVARLELYAFGVASSCAIKAPPAASVGTVRSRGNRRKPAPGGAWAAGGRDRTPWSGRGCCRRCGGPRSKRSRPRGLP